MSDELYENEIYILKLATNPKTYETLTTFMKSQPRHPISQSKMKEWINKQPYTLFTDVAQYICNNITYIPVEKVIEKIENVGTYIYERHYNQGHNFVFHVTNYIGLEQKSNSFFTVLVMSYIYTKYKTFFPVTIDLETSVNDKYGYDVFYMDIDDMCYTGTQTRAQLEHIFFNNISNPEMFMKKIKYEIIRLYITDIAIDTIKGDDPKIFPIIILKDTKLRFNEKIDSCFEIFEKAGQGFSKVYSAINTLFFNLRTFPITITYFDHKIADLPSTCSFMLTNGFIPSTSLINRVLEKKTKNMYYDSHVNDKVLNLIRTLLYSEDESYSKNNKKECNFINFVDNCSSALNNYGSCNDETNKAIDNINKIILIDEFDYESTINDEINKCPTPYYKSKEYKNIVVDLLINENYIGNTNMHMLFSSSGDIKPSIDKEFIEDILFKRNILGFTPFFYFKLSNKKYNNLAKEIINIIKSKEGFDKNKRNIFIPYIYIQSMSKRVHVTFLHHAIASYNDDIINHIIDNCGEYAACGEFVLDYYKEWIKFTKNNGFAAYSLPESTIQKLKKIQEKQEKQEKHYKIIEELENLSFYYSDDDDDVL